MWYSNTVKIPEKEYYVIRPTDKSENDPNENLLGFMVPFGTDKAYQKRKDTADRWATPSPYYYKQRNLTLPTPKSDIFDNKPISGFKLTFDVRNGYKYSPDAWRVKDPRGFVVEIRSDNLAQLMRFAKIEGGEIIGECIWAREGSRNVLLSVNTEEYKEATRVTEAASKTKGGSVVPISKLPIGHTVTLDTGYKGVYLGKYMAYKSIWAENEPFYKPKMVYAFHVMDYRVSKYGKVADNGMLYERASVKVATIDDTSTMDEAAAEKRVNELIQMKDCLSESQFMVSMKGSVITYDLASVGTIGDFTKKHTHPTGGYVSFPHKIYIDLDGHFIQIVSEYVWDSKLTARKQVLRAIHWDKNLMQQGIRPTDPRHQNFTASGFYQAPKTPPELTIIPNHEIFKWEVNIHTRLGNSLKIDKL